MKRATPWLAVVFLFGCAALGYLAFRQTAAVRHWTAEDMEAQKRILGLQHELSAAKDHEAKTAKQIARLASATSALAGSNGEGANGAPRIIHIGDVLKEHPEFTSLYERQVRRNIDRTYGNTLDSLNLTPTQLSQLKNLLAERQMDTINAQGAAATAGLVRGSPEYQEAVQQATQDVEQQISAILGTNADATLLQLQTRAAIQNQVQTTYASDFADAGMPLTADESSGLVQAMANANYAGKDTSTRPPNYNTADPSTGLSPHDDSIINNAAPVLNPAQLQLLKTDQVETEQMRAIMRQYNSGGGPVMFAP